MPMILWAAVGILAAFAFVVLSLVAFFGWMAYKVETMTKRDPREEDR